MNVYQLNFLKDGLKSFSSFFNTPAVKEGFKNVTGVATFTFGLIACYDLVQTWRKKKVLVKDSSPNKMIKTCNKASLIFSAAVSRPGVAVISYAAGKLFTKELLERLFGPNTTFAINPRHPRHVFSIVAVILALPSIGNSVYNGVKYMTAGKKFFQIDKKPDHKMELMIGFNTITSRPVVHIVNAIIQKLL